MNKTFLAKWLQRLGQEEESFWKKVIAIKYGLEHAWETKRRSSSHGVCCWKGIMQSMGNFKESIWVQVSSGRKTLFWNDLWCTHRPLKVEVPHIYEMTLD